MSTTLASDVDVLERFGTALADTTGRRIRAMLLADHRLAGALRELARVVLDSPACPAHLDPAHDHHPPRPHRP
jgi:hypothetical protein